MDAYKTLGPSVLDSVVQELKEDALRQRVKTPIEIGRQFVQPVIGITTPRAKFLPVIVANSLSIVAGATTVLLSYTVPLGYAFEVHSLSLEATTSAGNTDCQFIVTIDGIRVTDASNIQLALWNIAKENTGFNLLLAENQLLEISIRNTSGSTAHTVNGCMNGRRTSIT